MKRTTFMQNASRATGIAKAMTLGFALAATPVSALELSNLSEDERNAFRDEVRAYLLDNPEVLMEAIGVLEQRQADQQAAGDADLLKVNAEDLFNDGFSHVAGNPDGDVTIVEFVDYRCGYCRKAFADVNQLLEKDPNIRLILKEFPILGEESLASARFAVSAQVLLGEAAYAKLHDALMTLRGAATVDNLIALADGMEFDGQAIADGMEADEVTRRLGENHQLAQRLRISGTPAFVMGDTLARGYMPLAQMEAMIADIRDKK